MQTTPFIMGEIRRYSFLTFLFPSWFLFIISISHLLPHHPCSCTPLEDIFTFLFLHFKSQTIKQDPLLPKNVSIPSFFFVLAVHPLSVSPPSTSYNFFQWEEGGVCISFPSIQSRNMEECPLRPTLLSILEASATPSDSK